MQVRSEPSRGTLVVEPVGVQFELDCADGTATLELAERRFRLHPLRWTEKLRLARYARLGPAFLESQLLRIGLGDQADLDPETSEREILLTVARWLNGLVAEPIGLPLQSTLLATITLDVCRALGTRPADLDSREAAEVEQLWEVARGTDRIGDGAAAGLFTPGSDHPSSIADPDDDFTRILIVPDPPAESAPAAELESAPKVSRAERPGEDVSSAVAWPRPESSENLSSRSAPSGSELPHLEPRPVETGPMDRPAMVPSESRSAQLWASPARYRVVDPETVLRGGDREPGAPRPADWASTAIAGGVQSAGPAPAAHRPAPAVSRVTDPQTGAAPHEFDRREHWAGAADHIDDGVQGETGRAPARPVAESASADGSLVRWTARLSGRGIPARGTESAGGVAPAVAPLPHPSRVDSASDQPVRGAASSWRTEAVAALVVPNGHGPDPRRSAEPSPGWPEPVGVGLLEASMDTYDRENLFEELSERLEQAADELGIDVRN